MKKSPAPGNKAVAPRTPSPRKKPVVQKARRQRIAAKIVNGGKVSAIAKEEGISRSWASQEAHSDETQAIIAMMVDQRRPRMLLLLDRAMNAINDSLDAVKTVVVGGVVEDAGPDHYARLTGVKRFIELSLAGRVLSKPEDKKATGPITLQAIEEAIAAAKGDA